MRADDYVQYQCMLKEKDAKIHELENENRKLKFSLAKYKRDNISETINEAAGTMHLGTEALTKAIDFIQQVNKYFEETDNGFRPYIETETPLGNIKIYARKFIASNEENNNRKGFVIELTPNGTNDNVLIATVRYNESKNTIDLNTFVDIMERKVPIRSTITKESVKAYVEQSSKK